MLSRVDGSLMKIFMREVFSFFWLFLTLSALKRKSFLDKKGILSRNEII
jgi:hypothetical protein